MEPVELLKLIGPGMHQLRLGDEQLDDPASHGSDSSRVRERYSRTIGALGEVVWTRLVGLRYGIIGTGRTGSLVARSLLLLGACHLTLIDPDVLESHNLGEMAGVGEADVGHSKAEALGRSLTTEAIAPVDILPVGVSITHLRALHAAMACDVLFGCADHDGARLATATIASLFLKPLIDIGAGIHGRGNGRVMGADVRLVFPGRCLLCLGGFRDEAGARSVLTSAEAERTFYAGRNWRAERAGSLHSLNQLAASVAVRLLEDTVGERVGGSTWAHMEFDDRGRLSVTYPLPGTATGEPCPLCALSGRGEDGLAMVSGIVSGKENPLGV